MSYYSGILTSYHQSLFQGLIVLYKYSPDAMPITQIPDLLSFKLPANPVGRVQDFVHVVMLDE